MDSSKASGTPLNVPAMTSIFSTPDADAESTNKNDDDIDLAIDDASLADRPGLNSVLNKDSKTSVKSSGADSTAATGAPRFQASLAWAADTSPAVLGSAERRAGPVRTFGVTLKAAGGKADEPSTPVKVSERVRDIVKEVDECLGRNELKEVTKIINLMTTRISHKLFF